MIPKIIHQTWKTNDIPEEWKDAVNSCKSIHKEFKYMLWTDETMDVFVKTYYPEFYKTYHSYKYDIQRCDAFRYLVLYKYGGIYLDMDIICKKKINDLLKYDIVLAHSSNVKTSFTNSFFMVSSNHPFMKYCIDHLSENVNKYQYFGKHLHVMYSSGPLFLNNMISDYGDLENHHNLNAEEFAGDCNVCNEDKCKGGIYFSHIRGQTWNEMDSFILNFLLCNKNIILIILFILIILVIGILIQVSLSKKIKKTVKYK